MEIEWYYSVGGEQLGPVSWETLKKLASEKKLAASDLVWNESMAEWVEAQKVEGLVPQTPAARKPPPLPVKAAATAQVAKPATTAGNATFEVIIEPHTGKPSGEECQEVKLYVGETYYLVPFKLSDGLQWKYPRQVATGVHLFKIVPLTRLEGLKKLLFVFGKTHDEAPAEEQRYRVQFPSPGHYSVKFLFDEPRSDVDFPTDVLVTKEKEVVKDVGVFAGWRESSRRSQLVGLWEPANFSSQWFMFTKDDAMLRGDGMATKFRWIDDDKIELYSDETDKTVQFTVLSLGEFELILKVGDQTGHFKKGVTITEELRCQREEEYRKRRAEAAVDFKNVAFGVASVLAAGGFAVLCCGVAVGAASSVSRCGCRWPIPRGGYCANCGLRL